MKILIKWEIRLKKKSKKNNYSMVIFFSSLQSIEGVQLFIEKNFTLPFIFRIIGYLDILIRTIVSEYPSIQVKLSLNSLGYQSKEFHLCMHLSKGKIFFLIDSSSRIYLQVYSRKISLIGFIHCICFWYEVLQGI
jgi:hypothetical protein